MFPINIDELTYLTECKYNEKLQAWDKNYDREGNWITKSMIVFKSVDEAFDKIRKKRGCLSNATIQDLKNICIKLQLPYSNKNKTTLVDTLKEPYESFCKRAS